MSRAPSLSVINLQIAAAYRQKKDFDAAIAAYNELLKSDPSNDKAHVGVGMALMEKGDGPGAERTLEAAAQMPDAGRDVLFHVGEVKYAKGDTDEAMRWYRKAADADPYWGKPLYKLGLCAVKKGDKAGAAKLFEQVLAVDPVSPEAAMAKTTLDSLNK
jgi:Tfp pilus assembly protein PilF